MKPGDTSDNKNVKSILHEGNNEVNYKNSANSKSESVFGKLVTYR